MKRVLTPEMAAEMLEVAVYTISDWLRRGKIPGFKLGRKWKLHECAVQDWIENGGQDNHPDGYFDNSRTLKDREEDEEEERKAEEAREGKAAREKGDEAPRKRRNRKRKENEQLEQPVEVKDDDWPIMAFAVFETGGMVERKQIRFPLSWMPRIMKVIRKVAAYEDELGNFVRDAVFWRLLQMEQRIGDNSQNDPVWAMRREADMIQDRLRAETEMMKTLTDAAQAVMQQGDQNVKQRDLERLEIGLRMLPDYLVDSAVNIINQIRRSLGLVDLVGATIRAEREAEERNAGEPGSDGTGPVGSTGGRGLGLDGRDGSARGDREAPPGDAANEILVR